MVEVYEFLAQGGLLMVPILGMSVVGLAFFLERLWALRRERVVPVELVRGLRASLERGDLEGASALCEAGGSPIGEMVSAGLAHAGRARSVVKEVMLEKGEREVYFLERFVNALGAIATVAPLMGLLGTVIGMIDVFRQVVVESSAGGAVDPSTMAAGIWTALITTAAGLTVAIPVYLGYRYIMARIDRFAVELEDVALEMVDLLMGDASEDGGDRGGASVGRGERG